MTTQINVKVSEEDLERWKRASTSAGRTLSEWLRNLANDALTTKAPDEPKISPVGDESSAFERASCKDCGHARHMHRGFGSCCQVLNCFCLGFDGVVARPTSTVQPSRPHAIGCKCDVCKPKKAEANA